MNSNTPRAPGWMDDARSLLAYLAQPHAGHAYAEDLLDAVALLTSWVLVGMAVALVAGVLVEGLLQRGIV